MSKRWRALCQAAGIVACLCSTEAIGAEALNVAAEMDRYVENPRSPGVYRALSNMGDPDFGEAARYSGSPWEISSEARELFDTDWSSDCRTDYAMKTYRERVQRFGADHRYVKQWLDSQNAVFSACKGWREQRQVRKLPPPMTIGSEDAARLQRADRAYQAASQLFYLAKIAEARASFAAIAAQKGPHQSAAAYMVAAIDAGSRAGKSADAKPGAIQEARSLVNGRKAPEMRSAAHDLVGWLGATADTKETRAAQVAVTLEALHLPLDTIRSDPQARDRYTRANEDLPRLWTDFENADWWLSGAIPREYFGSQAMAEKAKTDRLAAFALTPGPCFASDCHSNDRTDELISQRAAETAGDKDAWDVAWVQRMAPYNDQDRWTEIDQLIARVQQAPTDHDVAKLALLADWQLHRAFSGARWNESENRAERQKAATLMARWPWLDSRWFAQRYSQSLTSLAGQGYLVEARSLRDRVGARLTETKSYAPGELLLLLAEDRNHFVEAMVGQDQQSSALLDRLPIRELQTLAQDQRIAASDRARLARVAWTRSYLLEQRMPKDLDSLMRSLNPDLAPVWQSKIGARTSDHALLLDLLRTPAMNLRASSRFGATGWSDETLKLTDLDVYEHSLNNWWCGPLAVEFNERDERAVASALGEEGSRPSAEKMLAESWVWQVLDRREREALGRQAMAPRILAERAVAWGKRANPRRADGADEALAFAVRSTRYGCQFQGGHGQWSKAAWDTLHQRFPGSPAARRTRWWFDCKHFTYGCTDAASDDQPAWPDEPAPAAAATSTEPIEGGDAKAD